MKNRWILLSLALVVALVVASQLVWAGNVDWMRFGQGRSHGHMFFGGRTTAPRDLGAVDATAEEVAALEALSLAHLSEIGPLRDEMAVLRVRLRSLVLGGEAGSEAAQALRADIDDLAEAMRLLSEEHRLQMEEILPPGQARFRGHMGFGPGMGRGPGTSRYPCLESAPGS